MRKWPIIALYAVFLALLWIGIFSAIQQEAVYDYQLANQWIHEQQSQAISLESLVLTVKENLRKPAEATPDYLKAYGFSTDHFKTRTQKRLITLGLILSLVSGFIYLVLWLVLQNHRNHILKKIVHQLDHLDQRNALFEDFQDQGYQLLTDALEKNVQTLYELKSDAIANQKALTQNLEDIAHQIKTPLTSMSLMTEVLADTEPDAQGEIIGRITSQINRLDCLTTGLLKLSTLGSTQFLFKKETILLSDLLERIIEPLAYLANSKNITMNLPQNCNATIECDIQWTIEGFFNIVKNAIEHSKENTTVTLSYTENPLYHEFSIEDSGSGFCKEDLPHLFERFYRGKNAKKDSIGIGLAISKSIFDGQNGEIKAVNHQDHGQFVVKMFRY